MRWCGTRGWLTTSVSHGEPIRLQVLSFLVLLTRPTEKNRHCEKRNQITETADDCHLTRFLMDVESRWLEADVSDSKKTFKIEERRHKPGRGADACGKVDGASHYGTQYQSD